jgi:hypothetical protein
MIFGAGLPQPGKIESLASSAAFLRSPTSEMGGETYSVVDLNEGVVDSDDLDIAIGDTAKRAS